MASIGTGACRENHALEIVNLRKRYGSGAYALDGVTLSFGQGLSGLLGPNGAGKSTLMRCIAGVENWDAGTIEIVASPAGRSERPSVGYLPESVAFPRELRVRSFLRLACSAKGVGKGWRRETDEKLEATGLAEVADRLIGSLSKGYRQRLGLAQALIGDPSILILDEPVASLDPINIVDVRRVIRDYACSACVIVSTHQLAEATSLCDRVVLLDRGRIAYDGPLSGLGRGNLRAFDIELVTGDGDACPTEVRTVTVADERELAEQVAGFVARGYGVIGIRPVRDAIEMAFADAVASAARPG